MTELGSPGRGRREKGRWAAGPSKETRPPRLRRGKEHAKETGWRTASKASREEGEEPVLEEDSGLANGGANRPGLRLIRLSNPDYPI